jgi:lipoprotein-anchoring transpeptidase ErfK/SrfK
MSTTASKRFRRFRSATALLAVALAVSGCESGEERAAAPPQPSPPPAPTASEPVIVRAGVPIEGYLAVDPEQLEAERLDEAWRAGAEWDRRMREEGRWPTSAAPATGVSPSPAAGAEPSPAAVSDAAQVPVERMRTSLAGAGERSPGEPPVAAPERPPAEGAAEGAAESAAESEPPVAPESWEDIAPQAFASFAPRLPIPREGGGPTVLAVQQLLDRVRFSPGVIDGRWGKNTEKAVYWLQDSLGREPTGAVDADLFALLEEAAGTTSPLRRYTLTAADVAGPFTDIPPDYVEQAALECLCYGSPAEALAERFHLTPDLLAQLNPDADLDHLAAGSLLWVPDVEPLAAGAGSQATAREAAGEPPPIAELVISKDGFYLQALDAAREVLYHFPITVGAGYDASPSGELTVTATAFDPTFHYQPKLFADVDDAEPEAMLPAGPNSPVGVVWMQLSKDNYGIHGTAEPATIGYRTSHGCVRMTNWDAQFLAHRLPSGTPVLFHGVDAPATAAR